MACWRCSHGGPGPLAVPQACTRSTEELTFAWLRLLRCIRKLAALPGRTEGALAAAIQPQQDALEAMSASLGVAGGLPPKPLLWKHAGHPPMAPTIKLAETLLRVQQLCGISG